MFGRRSLYERRLAYYFYMLNPVTPVINMFRYAFLGTGSFEWFYWLISLGVTVLVALFGLVVFSKVEKNFIDTV